MPDSNSVKVAVLDLYNGVENQGMRCIKDILKNSSHRFYDTGIHFDVFDVRAKDEVPGLDYDIYISSGGPGSPFDGLNMLWEKKYFEWMDNLWNYNQSVGTKKHLLSICHSFQLMCRHFDLAEVEMRKSDSFGIMPVHLTEDGKKESLFTGLDDPFYAADFREWQVLQPNTKSIRGLGAKILAIEKNRPHVPLERAIMAMRISDEIIGTQFHPEADPEGMLYHFTKEEQRLKIVDKHGVNKFNLIVERLKDDRFLVPTYNTFIPSFLKTAIEAVRVGIPA
jgi:homoserine O-succinyltransferase/O-acetyltransferase